MLESRRFLTEQKSNLFPPTCGRHRPCYRLPGCLWPASPPLRGLAATIQRRLLVEEIWQALPDEQDFEDLTAYLWQLIARPDDAIQLGQHLRAFLLPQPIWELFIRSRERVAARGCGLRIRLHIQVSQSELSRIPWEYCADNKDRFLALDPCTPLVRYLPVSEVPQPVALLQPMRMLLVAADPHHDLDLSGAIAQIQEAMQPLVNEKRLELTVLDDKVTCTHRRRIRPPLRPLLPRWRLLALLCQARKHPYRNRPLRRPPRPRPPQL